MDRGGSGRPRLHRRFREWCRREESGPVTLKIAYPVAVDAPVTDMLNDFAAAFMAENPNVTVETVYAGGYTDVKTMVQTTIDGGGEAPALAVMLATDVYDLANAQYIEPLTPFVDEMKSGKAYIKDFLPGFMANSYYMDNLWSLPFQRSAVVLYYNADLLASVGCDHAPADWNELAEVGAALTVKDGGQVTRWGIEWSSDWPYWTFQPLAVAAGQNIVGESDTAVFFDNPAVISAVQYYIDLSHKYGATPEGVQACWGTSVPNFVSGNTAMIVHSSGSLSKILSQADFKVGVSAVPGPKAGSAASVPGGGNIYMIAGMSDAEKQAAFDFAVFLTGASRAAEFSIKSGYIATSKSAAEDPAMKAYAAENPQVAQVQEALAKAGKELSLQNLGEVRTIFHSAIQSAYNGEMTPAAAMAKAQREADAALEDFR